MKENIETVVIGGGQAGLSISHFLSQAGREHIVLEKSSQVADVWRNHRWDSFTLVTPNWAFRLPDAEYTGPEPEGFMPKAEVIRRLEQFQQDNHTPVKYETEAVRIEPLNHQYRYRVVTNNQIYESKNVVLASGVFQKGKIPTFAAKIPPDILQITSDTYRNPQQLPAGAVLVVGSGQSGCQIAEELHESGRKVFFSTSSAGRVPAAIAARTASIGLYRIGFFDRTQDMLPTPQDRFSAPPHATGKNGGHDINLHMFSRQGITLLGHARDFEDGKLLLKDDLRQNLAKADGFAVNMVKMIDDYIQKQDLDSPADELLSLDDGYKAAEIRALDLSEEGVSAIIWACGFSFDYRLVQLPVLDAFGYPVVDRRGDTFSGFVFSRNAVDEQV